MIEIRRILCPIDFSDCSRRALDHAVAIARWYGSTITAMHVFVDAPVAAYAHEALGPERIALTGADRDQLLGEIRRFSQTGTSAGIPVEAAVREGNTAREILSQAIDMQADLLVLGTHGRSGLDRLLLGSVTEKLLRKASCPVLTVPHHHPDVVPATPVLFKQILCPVDFSECSMQALQYATSLAQEADARLVVMHVLSHELDAAPEAYESILMDDRVSVGDLRRRREEEAWRRLKEAVPESVSAYCRVETMIASGKPGREILRVAAEQQTELIVLGVQGRGAVDLLFFGSTTNHIVREAKCPVLTLRRR